MSCAVATLLPGGVFAVARFQTPRQAIEETFKEDIVIETSRRQRIERIQMKKQALKATKTKRTTRAAKAPDVAWHARAQELPIALFHTTIGPIIGHVDAVGDPGAYPFNLRLWAPAAIRMGFQPGQPGAFVTQYSVTFQPIALVETYLDLSAETPFGRSPVPEALVPAYADYFRKVAAGEYSFTRVVTNVQQAAPHEAPVGAPANVQDVPTPSSDSDDDGDDGGDGGGDENATRPPDESTLS